MKVFVPEVINKYEENKILLYIIIFIPRETIV